MLDGHEIKIERRTARCCDEHIEDWVICSCGWEDNTGLSGGDIRSFIIGHRLAIIESELTELKSYQKGLVN